MEAPEDKLALLTTIFGNDLTESVIVTALRENDNQFDPAVEKLLTVPTNKIHTPPPQEAPMDGKARENIQRLHTMFGDLTQSVITTVFETNKRDVEGTVDTLLNLTSNEVASGARKEAEIARQEQELRSYEEFKKMQQRLQENERKSTEAAQRAALQKAKDDEERKKADEAQQRVEQEKKRKEEHAQALMDQERLLQEFQRKKAEDERLKKEREEGKARELGLEQAREEERKRSLEADKKRVQEEKRLLEAEKKLVEERHRQLVQARAEEEKEKKRRAAEEEERKRVLERKKRADEEKRAQEEAEKKKRTKEEEAEKKRLEEIRLNEERIVMKKLEEENQQLQKQKNMAEAERKLLEARMKEEMLREEEERKRFDANEKRFREEQENIRKNWEEKMKQLENERKVEEQRRLDDEAKRTELKRLEEEERTRQEADMRRILELERLKLDEQRKRVEEEKKNAEERLRAMELAARKRDEEEEQRKQMEEERKREEEERAQLLEEEIRTRERIKEEMLKVLAQEQFAASAILVTPEVNEPKVQILSEVEGSEIRGTWTLLQGVLPSTQSWLGLFPRRSINTYVGFLYVSGTSGEFQFKGLTPGHYEVRLFANKLVTSRIAESLPLLVGPKVSTFAAQLQEEQIMLEYKLDPPSVPSSWDWVGIFEKTQRRNKPYISSVYGNANGSVSVALPRTPGTYEARLFAAGSKYNEQASVDFVVEDNDRVSAALTEGVIKASWVLRTAEPTSSDWIGLFAAGEASNKYLACVYTHGASTGEVDIPLPKDIALGVYELRLFSSKVGKYIPFKTSDIIAIN